MPFTLLLTSVRIGTAASFVYLCCTALPYFSNRELGHLRTGFNVYQEVGSGV